jgi:hypothetical protein
MGLSGIPNLLVCGFHNFDIRMIAIAIGMMST